MIQLDLSDHRPLYEQIKDKIKQALRMTQVLLVYAACLLGELCNCVSRFKHVCGGFVLNDDSLFSEGFDLLVEL